MKIFECKCGSKEIFIKDSGNNKGLYCADCGKWMQWLGKDDLRLAERQIEQSIINPIPRNLDELKEHDKKIRADAIDELLGCFFDMYCGIDSQGFIGKNCVANQICTQTVCYYKLLEEKAKDLKEQK